MQKNKTLNLVTISFSALVLIWGIAFDAQAQSACEGCNWSNYLQELGQAESGSATCPGGGSEYQCVGPLITDPDSAHTGDRPQGRYQFMPNTLAGYGITDIDAFLNDPALQDEIALQFTMDNVSCLESAGSFGTGSGHSCSGLAAAAHLGGCGGAQTVAEGGNTADVVNTSYGTAQRAEEFQDVCAGQGATTVRARATGELLGCDPAVLDQNETIVDAMNERDMQVAKSMITQPASIAQTTCTDQHIQTQSAAGGILSNLPGGNISETITPLIEQPFIKNLTSNFMPAEPLAGSIQSMITNSYAQVTEQFNTMMSGLSGGLLGGLGGGLGGGGAGDISGGCDMMNESWLLSQCIQMPKFPSVNDILNGALENVTGAVTDLINSPFKALDQVCQGMSDKLGDFSSDASSIFEDAINSATSPITDSLNQATDNITNIGN